LLTSWENFFTRRMYHRIQDCWNRPITGPPGAHINILQRESDDHVSFRTKNDAPPKRCLNLGSYNYLGFADDWKASCSDEVFEALDKYSAGSCSTRSDIGTHTMHQRLEQRMADFIGKESCFVFNMGYGTNTGAIPSIAGKGCLIVSDSLNHTSIVNGARSSGAKIKVFKHNDHKNLNEILREAIADGQPRTHRPWKKILVMIEGIYSMEGEICNLPAILEVAKRNKCYLYVDEAHSIGALGKTGRGVCEHWGVDPAEIDILMGTFTKSFGGMGGYICATKEIVEALKQQSSGNYTSHAMSPIMCQQIITAIDVIDGKDGTNTGQQKLAQIYDNSNYFRLKLKEMGCEVFGDTGSPVVPLMLYNPAKIAAFSRECYKRGLAVVVVGFPATPLVLSRARFCISAAHTREDLDDALEKIEEVAKLLKVRYRFSTFG